MAIERITSLYTLPHHHHPHILPRHRILKSTKPPHVSALRTNERHHGPRAAQTLIISWPRLAKFERCG